MNTLAVSDNTAAQQNEQDIYLFKRDGRKEKADPLKLIKWGEWGRRSLGNRVRWVEIMTETIAQIKNGMTTRAVQDLLIKNTLAYGDDAHARMAGTLYGPTLQKDLYPNGIPTIKELQTKLRDLGFMKHIQYTDAEYAQLEAIIDHSIDFDYRHFQIKHITRKYAIQNRDTDELYETPQFTFMRMAMEVYSKEPVGKRVEMVREFYSFLADNTINAPSPNYISLGTPKSGLMSCCLYKAGDNIGSLNTGDAIAYRMTAIGAGIGGMIATRGLGEPVRNGSIVHQGKQPYYAIKGKAVKGNIQSGRAGAAKTEYNIFDVEAYQIAGLQNPRTPATRRNRDMHFAVQYHSLFIKKALLNEDIFTFSVRSAPDLFQAFYGPDKKKFEELYAKYEADEKFVKNYVNARDLLLMVARQGPEVGTHYEFYSDNVNYNTPYKEPIFCSNLCVAPETMLLTDKGEFEIESLVGQTVNVWNGERWSETTVVKTGENQELWDVTTSDGKSLSCTPYHKWYVIDGYGQEPMERRTHELMPGDKLIKFDAPVIEGTERFPIPYASGFATGDGTTLTNSEVKIYLYGEKANLKHRFPDTYQWRENHGRFVGMGRGVAPKFTVPTVNHTIQDRLEWLSGFFDADGTVNRNGTCESISACSNNFEMLQQVQSMLLMTGIQSKVTKANPPRHAWMPKNDGTGEMKLYKTKPTWRIHITAVDTQKLYAMGFNTSRLKVEQREPQRAASHFVTVVDVSNNGRTDDTYCVTEKYRHMAVFNGILTGQCTEIVQPTWEYEDLWQLYVKDYLGKIKLKAKDKELIYDQAMKFLVPGNPDPVPGGELEEGMTVYPEGEDESSAFLIEQVIERERQPETSLCALGGLVVSNIRDDHHCERAMYHTQRMINYCIENSSYPFPQIEFTAKKRMNAGIGILGLATVLARKNLRFDSVEGMAEIHRVCERHMYYAIKCSIQLGKELGNAPWINRTKWVDGWLPIDTYNKSVDEVCNTPLQYDWEALRKALIANKGMRFSSLVAHMPTESSSKAAGCPNGVYPIRELSIGKSDATNTIDWTAPDSDLIGHQYQLAYDIDIFKLIDCYSIIQKFTDQAISADLYIDRRETLDLSATHLIKITAHMQRRGMKSRYYVNSRTDDTSAGDLSAVSSKGCASGACTL